MTDPSTIEKINSWAQQKTLGAAPSLSSVFEDNGQGAATGTSGMLGATSTPSGNSGPATQAQPTTWQSATSATPSNAQTMTATASANRTPWVSADENGIYADTTTKRNPEANVANWYRGTFGRDGDAAGIAYWTKALDDGMDPDKLYQMFQQSGASNGELVRTGTGDWYAASTYNGPRSTDPNSSVDDWALNMMGQSLSAGEKASWEAKLKAAQGIEGADAVYQQFLDTYKDKIGDRPILSRMQASQIAPGRFGTSNGGNSGATLINLDDLAKRVIDPTTETVRGQLGMVMAENSPVLQQARADAQRGMYDRGLGNSAMANSAGEDAVVRSALQIATPDAATYGHASDYNVAARNQATMWNADQENQFKRLQMQLDADAQARVQQMSIAQMQDATSRWQTEANNATSRYNSDNSYKQQMDAQKRALVNNIIQNMEMSPDRKAAMLEQLGEGTSAHKDANGNWVAGTGLAGAVWVIDSIAPDLDFSGGGGGSGGGSSNTGNGSSGSYNNNYYNGQPYIPDPALETAGG